MTAVKNLQRTLASLLLAAAPLALHAQPIPAASVSKVLGIPGVVYKVVAKRQPSQVHTEHEYNTAQGETVLLMVTGPFEYYAGLKSVAEDMEPVAGLATQAAFSKSLGMLCARTSTKSACLTQNIVYFFPSGKPKPSAAQLKELLQQAF